jgi:xanthine/CO dehydrogenase XdhC/CoxF family maturation factor
MAEIGDKASALQYRMHGPAGIDIGGSGPAAIALSIVAEMHRVLMR